MLFQGQELRPRAPFLYFADHDAELADAGAQGARPSSWPVPQPARPPRCRPALPDPGDARDLRALQARLRRARDARPAEALRAAPRPARAAPRGPGARARRRRRRALDGAVLGRRMPSCCASSATDGDDRLLIVNLGRDLRFAPAPEPLLAPPRRTRAGQLAWSSESTALRRRAARRRSKRTTTAGASRARRPSLLAARSGGGQPMQLTRDRSPGPATAPAGETTPARRASGWSPTASAATPRAPSPASPRAATTACSSPRCPTRSAAR